MIFPVKIYKPNEHGELEYVETIYKDAVISHHWLPVTCKKCRVLKRLKPKLASIRRQIASYEKRLKELKSLEKRYQGELGNASK